MMSKKPLCLAVLGALVISSCSMPLIQNTKKAVASAKAKGNLLAKQSNTPLARNYVSFSDKPYLGSNSFEVKPQAKPLPKIFGEPISLHSTSKSDISGYISKLSNLIDIDISISNEAMDFIYNDSSSSKGSSKSSTTAEDTSYPTKQIINYSGTLKGYLDKLTNRFGLSWRYDYSTNKITIFHTETKTFKLAVPESQIANITSIANTDSNNKSSVSYKTKTMDAFSEAIATIKSFDPSIQISANNSYAMITVTATPRLMEKVSNYIKRFNKEAQEGVEVKIAVYAIKTNKPEFDIMFKIKYTSTKKYFRDGSRNYFLFY